MTNETAAKLKIPAIGLIAVGILNILIGLYFLLSAIYVSYAGVVYKNFTEEQKTMFNIGLYGIMILGILSLLVAPVIIYGAMKMMRGEKPGWRKIAAISGDDSGYVVCVYSRNSVRFLGFEDFK